MIYIRMAKVIYILRHGQAEPGWGNTTDFQRKLTAQGRNDVQSVAALLKQKHLTPHLLIKSPAYRTLETAQLVEQALPAMEVKTVESLYESSLENLLEVLQKIPEENESVMLVGHNPSLNDLVNYLSEEPMWGLKPGMCVKLELFVEKWLHLTRGAGEIQAVLE